MAGCGTHEPLLTRIDEPTRNPTTSFLTATTLIYAIGAGITAAAGRLTSRFLRIRSSSILLPLIHDSQNTTPEARGGATLLRLMGTFTCETDYPLSFRPNHYSR